MRVIGFDPGINVTGFGILDYNKRNAKAHGYGVIKPPQKNPLQDRLKYLHEETMKLLKNFNAVVETLEKEKKNNTLKGDLIKNIFLTSTMGVSYKIKLTKNI